MQKYNYKLTKDQFGIEIFFESDNKNNIHLISVNQP
jgi:hypothetical protein